MERFDHEKNQHIYLEKATKDEKTPAIAVFFLKKSPKYLILSGLVKLVEKKSPTYANGK